MNMPATSLSDEKEKRAAWAARRLAIETHHYKHYRYGKKRKSHWSLFERIVQLFGLCLKCLRLYERGFRNATNVVIREIQIAFPDLPEAFDGYTILHLTDLHLDHIAGIEDAICKQIERTSHDLVVFTGDYREKTYNGFRDILPPLKRIVQTTTAKDGIIAVLGNHDTCKMVSHMEDMGITVLANETITHHRQNDTLSVTGIDDPHYFYTEQAMRALDEPHSSFKIALVHSPELYDAAADRAYRLYLCGHTHGGQICLPGGFPIITHLYAGKRYSRGLWRCGDMFGYTSSGCGTVGIPIRFNCQSEIVLIRLKKGDPQQQPRVNAFENNIK